MDLGHFLAIMENKPNTLLVINNVGKQLFCDYYSKIKDQLTEFQFRSVVKFEVQDDMTLVVSIA